MWKRTLRAKKERGRYRAIEILFIGTCFSLALWGMYGKLQKIAKHNQKASAVAEEPLAIPDSFIRSHPTLEEERQLENRNQHPASA